MTILFSDIKGFTDFSCTREPAEVFGVLHQYYCAIDDIVLRHGAYKYEVAGDSFIAGEFRTLVL